MTRVLTLTFFFSLLFHAGPLRAEDELEKAFANPPESARALTGLIPQAAVLTPPSGHIGMVVGARAERGLWTPLRDWLCTNDKD